MEKRLPLFPSALRKASLVDHFKELQSGWVQKTVELEQNIPEKGIA